MIDRNIIERFRKYLNETKLIEKNKRYILSFSGGPDSVFLSYVLNNLGFEFDLFYLNHQLRKDSVCEEEFVLEFSKRMKKAVIVKRFDVEKFCKENKLGIEEGARIVRRQKLMEVYLKGSYNGVLLAHTLDDLIENFFIRMFRGSGFGLPGMIEKDGIFIRPILNFRKSEIFEFLKKNGISYYEDPSNLDKKFLRNRIRLELIPLVEEISPTGMKGILKTIQNIEDMKITFSQVLMSIQNKKYLTHLEFDSKRFINLPETLKFLFIRNMLSSFSGEFELKKEHIKKINKKIELKNFIVEINKNYGIIQKKIKLEERKIKTPVSLIFGDFYLEFETKEKIECYKYNENNYEVNYFDYNAIKEPLIIRTRKKGDKMVKFGKTKERKIKDFFIDKKIPKILRDFWPVICDKKGIILIPFVARSENGIITEKTKNVLVIKCRRIEDGWA